MTELKSRSSHAEVRRFDAPWPGAMLAGARAAGRAADSAASGRVER
jgi:hypothetical protein